MRNPGSLLPKVFSNPKQNDGKREQRAQYPSQIPCYFPHPSLALSSVSVSICSRTDFSLWFAWLLIEGEVCGSSMSERRRFSSSCQTYQGLQIGHFIIRIGVHEYRVADGPPQNGVFGRSMAKFSKSRLFRRLAEVHWSRSLVFGPSA